jgi:hypothetical protein
MKCFEGIRCEIVTNKRYFKRKFEEVNVKMFRCSTKIVRRDHYWYDH